jgi:hypothetical protein
MQHPAKAENCKLTQTTLIEQKQIPKHLHHPYFVREPYYRLNSDQHASGQRWDYRALFGVDSARLGIRGSGFGDWGWVGADEGVIRGEGHGVSNPTFALYDWQDEIDLFFPGQLSTALEFELG